MLLSQLSFAWFPTTTEGWIYEIVGIVASLLVFASFFWSNEKITRMVNMVGCIIFVIYAILIKSFSVCVINGACFILHVVKLVQMARNKKKTEQDKKTSDGVEEQTEASQSADSAENKDGKAE